MLRSRATFAAALVISALVSSAPAFAAVTGFTATLTAFVGFGNGIPANPTPLANAGGSLTSYTADSAFSLSAGVFTSNAFQRWATNQGGPVYLPTSPSTIYILGAVVNQVSGAGTFSSGGGPGGGFGGSLGLGASTALLLGFTPLPNVFGSLVIPVNAGSTATVTGMVQVLARPFSVTVSGSGWTTGTIHYDDRKLGSTTVSGAPIPNAFVTSGTAMGTNHLGSTPAGGGRITLVAPITIKLPNQQRDLRAGYHVLAITFVPEPATLLLLGAAAAGLYRIGRQCGS